jgi:hypothetical protein
MRHMGNSGRLAIVAAFAAAGLLVLTAITLEEAVLFTFLGAVAVGYLACVIQVVARGRNLALLAGGVGTSLFIGFSIAFLRMWGLAFTAEPDSLGTAVTTKDSDIYFYLAAVSGVGTLLVLFAGAVWPAGKRIRPGSRKQAGRRRPAGPARRPAVRQASRPAAGASYGRVPASRSGSTRAPAAKRPAPAPSSAKVSEARASRAAAQSAAPESAAPKSVPKPAPKSPAKATSRR